jgi:hypothetical protein
MCWWLFSEEEGRGGAAGYDPESGKKGLLQDSGPPTSCVVPIYRSASFHSASRVYSAAALDYESECCRCFTIEFYASSVHTPTEDIFQM